MLIPGQGIQLARAGSTEESDELLLARWLSGGLHQGHSRPCAESHNAQGESVPRRRSTKLTDPLSGRQLLLLSMSARAILPVFLSGIPQARGVPGFEIGKDQQRIQATHGHHSKVGVAAHRPSTYFHRDSADTLLSVLRGLEDESLTKVIVMDSMDCT